MSGTIIVELNDIRIYATHGLYAEEALTGQEFKLDIRLQYAAGSALINKIEETINYEEVFHLVRKEILSDRHQLLESCIMGVAEKLKTQYDQIQHLDIMIEKLNAPIARFSGKVGVRYSKNYP